MRAMRRAAAMLEQDLLGAPAFLMLSMVSEGALNAANASYLHAATADGLKGYIDRLPVDRAINWTSLCSQGNLLPFIPQIVAAGGHISIGLGDYPHEELGLPTNAALVSEVVRRLRSDGCEPASPDEAREMLGMRARQPATDARLDAGAAAG
jgi:uncharacterized protein (DUF849 family)